MTSPQTLHTAPGHVDVQMETTMANDHLPAYDNHPAMFRNHVMGYIGVWLLIFAPVLGLLMYRREVAEIGVPPAMLLLATGLGIVILLYWFMLTRATRLRITDDNVHVERGLLSKRHVELTIDQIRAVRVYQGPIDRIFRVGRIEVYTTGDDPEFVVSGMPDPNQVRDHVRTHKEEESSREQSSSDSHK
jgi:uncharacterized membrane protein YdbT with pleckstrin-like domain